MEPTSPRPAPCVVCGLVDQRALTSASLTDGTTVPLCGSHALVYRRATTPARSVDELVRVAGDRRRAVRRGRVEDELAAKLAEAFAPARRSTRDRRRAVGG